MPTVRAEPAVRRGLHRFQDIYVAGVSLRKEVREQGRTFRNLADYLVKYHGYKHFDLVAGTGKRIAGDWWIQIRYRPWWERLFRQRPDGQVWEAPQHGHP